LSELEAHHRSIPQPRAEPTRNENAKKLISLTSSDPRDVQRVATGNNTFFSKSVLSTGNAVSKFGGLNNVLPTFFLLNATSLAKRNARQHLHAEIYSRNSDIVLIVETWFTNIATLNWLLTATTCFVVTKRTVAKEAVFVPMLEITSNALFCKLILAIRTHPLTLKLCG
jgi:hypothetical protein